MNVLVTGGGGFLGRRIVEMLLEAGHEVRFLARSHYPEVEALGATGHQVDLCDALATRQAVEGVDTIVHVASKAGFWGSYASYYSTNVEGTRNLLTAAQELGVKRFIYTSTPSVIGYASDACGIASAPYPKRWESAYGETKALAEQMVLAANGDTLATISLRPHLIVGPRDNHLLPRVIARAAAGRLVSVGDGLNRVDLTYVDNAAQAHLDAAVALSEPNAVAAGKAYFLSNGEPVLIWSWINEVLAELNVPPVTRRIGRQTAHLLGFWMELLWRGLRLKSEPPMTRFLAAALSRAHWYDIMPLQQDIGYRPSISMKEGTALTVAWLKEIQKN